MIKGLSQILLSLTSIVDPLDAISYENESDHLSSDDMVVDTIEPTSASDIKEGSFGQSDEKFKDIMLRDPPDLKGDHCYDSLECLPEEAISHQKPSNEEETKSSGKISQL